MSLSIHLLGRPRLVRDGNVVDPPRGRKAWALLAYLALSDRPPTRRELAELLFADANDPLGALRWSLSQLRKALAPEVSIDGDPVSIDLGETELDVDALRLGGPVDRSLLEQLGAELLDGIEPANAPVFETWLLIERRRTTGAAETVLRESALAQLGAGNAGEAVGLARSALGLNPLDEDNHELLVRCLAASGDRDGALRQARSCEDLFRRELGIDPSPAVMRAADAINPHGRRGETRPEAARGLLDAGRAAIAAGASEAGISTLREACDQAVRAGDDALRAEALTTLGIALVHAVRGWDGEGSACLHRALVVAERAGDRETIVTVHRELGWVGAVSGRSDQAIFHLSRALDLASGDEEIAGVLCAWGINSSDQADYPLAREQLTESVERARRAGDEQRRAYSEGMLARVHLLTGELEEADRWAQSSIAAASEANWLAYVPFPEAIKAEADRLSGDLAAATSGFEHAFALGCRLEDPCWESMAARGLGLLAADAGDSERAVSWLEEAQTRCTRWPDRYEWAHGYALEAAARLALASGERERARSLVSRLREGSERAGLRELTCRALITQSELGDESALAVAEVIADQIENPLLESDLATARGDRPHAPAQPA